MLPPSSIRSTVYLVGAGPGAADLLTLRAARLLAQADIVFHDALVSDEVLALASQAKHIEVGKRCGQLSTRQLFINKQLIDATNHYRTIIRLKGGDPMIFGRAQEEIQALKEAGVQYEIVPGITTALAASAALGTSLTQRNIARSVAFVTPRIGETCTPSQSWVNTACTAESVVLYMAGHQLNQIQEILIAAGRDPFTPVVLMANVSYPDASSWCGHLNMLHTCTLTTEKKAQPMILLLGQVFNEHIDTLEKEAYNPFLHSIPA
jgi:uroporphyrin-III C-methyltransferase